MTSSSKGRSTFVCGMGVMLALAVLIRADAAVGAVTPGQACAAAKQKAVSKNAAAKLKCHAKATRSGAAVDVECLQKADAKLGTAFQRAESAGGCVTLGDAAAAAALGDDLVAAALAALPPALPTPTATPTATMPSDPTPQTTACATGSGSGPELWVAPDAAGGLGQDCGSATYASIQEAVSDATAANQCAPGSVTTVNVCPGTYAETLDVEGSTLTIRGVGSGAAILKPDGPGIFAIRRQFPNSDTLVAVSPLVRVHPSAFFGPTDITIMNLTLDGSSVDGATGIYVDFGGTPYSFSTAVSDVRIGNVALGVLAASTLRGPLGQADVTVTNSVMVNGGVECAGGADVVCTVSDNTIVDGGVDLRTGPFGTVSNNRIIGNSSYGTGVRLFAAGLVDGVPTRPTTVSGNTLIGHRVGVEVVDSVAAVTGNTISTHQPDAVGVYGVGCNALCDLGIDYSPRLSALAPADQPVTVSENRIVNDVSVTGAIGIWMGEDWNPGAPWSQAVTAVGNHFVNAGDGLRIDAGAYVVP